jgi:hypothetical protein
MTELDRYHIPQYGDCPETWERFLSKASMGSTKAIEMLRLAELANIGISARLFAQWTLNIILWMQLLRCFICCVGFRMALAVSKVVLPENVLKLMRRVATIDRSTTYV